MSDTKTNELDASLLIINAETRADKWAKSFNYHLSIRGEQPVDEGLMTSWFANIACVQKDKTSREKDKEISRLREEILLLEESNDFYADKENFNIGEFSRTVYEYKDNNAGSTWIGKKARSTKEKLKELRGEK